MGVFGVILLGGQAAQAAPLTKTQVSRPTTTQPVHQSFTQTAATHPTTTSAVDHPTTVTAATKPQTTTVVEHPTTSNVVSHPQTDAPANSFAAANTSSQASSSVKKSAGGADSAGNPSLMSTYTPPQATNFKEAKLGGGEEGLGKPNQAEKDAAAKAFVLPKGEEVSLENVMKSDGKTVNIKKKVEKKVNQGS